MAMRFLEPEAALNLMKLKQTNAPLPPQIVDLKNRIDAATKAAEMEADAGRVNVAFLDSIVEMKLDLDSLYGLWAEGKL